MNETIQSSIFQKIILIAISLFLVFSIFLVLNTNDAVELNNSSFCVLDYMKYQEIESFNDKITNYKTTEISVIPQVNNIFCLGKLKEVISGNDSTEVYFYTSSNFYSIFSFLGTFLIVIFFINKGKYHHFLFTLSLFYFFSFYFFYLLINQQQFFYKQSFIYVASICVFQILKRDNWELKIFDYATIFLMLLLFSDYQVFSNLLVLYFIGFFFKGEFVKKENLHTYGNLIKYLPLFFLLTRFLTSLSSRFDLYWRILSSDVFKSYKRFGDLQLTLNAVKCNFSNDYLVKQPFNFIDDYHSCPYETGYPLLDQYISLNLGNIWTLTILISFSTLILLGFQYLKLIDLFKNSKFYLFLIFLSPPLNFLIERMNIDLLIFTLLLYLQYRFNLSTYLKALISVFTAALKIYTLPLIFSLLTFSIIRKKKKEIITFCLSFSLTSIFFIDYFLLNQRFGVTSTNARELFFKDTLTNPSISFGLLSSSNFIKNSYSSFDLISVVFIGLVILFTLFVILKKFYNDELDNFIKNKLEVRMAVFLPVLILVLTYENYDYRLVFLILIFPLVVDLKIKILTTSYLYLIISSATNFIIFNEVLTLLNITSQLVVLSLISYIYFKGTFYYWKNSRSNLIEIKN